VGRVRETHHFRWDQKEVRFTHPTKSGSAAARRFRASPHEGPDRNSGRSRRFRMERKTVGTAHGHVGGWAGAVRAHGSGSPPGSVRFDSFKEQKWADPWPLAWAPRRSVRPWTRPGSGASSRPADPWPGRFSNRHQGYRPRGRSVCNDSARRSERSWVDRGAAWRGWRPRLLANPGRSVTMFTAFWPGTGPLCARCARSRHVAVAIEPDGPATRR
jgi:hypothetical protein